MSYFFDPDFIETAVINWAPIVLFFVVPPLAVLVLLFRLKKSARARRR